MRKRIFLDARFCETPHSGLVRYINGLYPELIQQIDKQKYDLRILVTRKCFDTSNDQTNALLRDNVQHIEITKTSPWSFFTFFWPLFFKLKQGDIIFTPHFIAPLYPFKNSYFVIHDLFPICSPNYFSKFSRLKTAVFFSICWLNLNVLKLVCFAPSETTRSRVHKYFGAKNKVISHLSGISFSQISMSRPAMSGPRITGEFLLYVGDRRPHKNILRLLKVHISLLRMKKDLSLVLVGDSKQRDTRTPQMGAFLSNDRVFELDGLDDNELLRMQREAAAIVLLSDDEGFGFPIVEAGISGKAVICSDNDIMREVAPPWACFVDLENMPDRMANHIKVYLESFQAPSLREIELYRKRFNWSEKARFLHAVMQTRT